MTLSSPVGWMSLQLYWLSVCSLRKHLNLVKLPAWPEDQATFRCCFRWTKDLVMLIELSVVVKPIFPNVRDTCMKFHMLGTVAHLVCWSVYAIVRLILLSYRLCSLAWAWIFISSSVFCSSLWFLCSTTT